MARDIDTLGLDSPDSAAPYTPTDGLDYIGRKDPDIGVKASQSVGTCQDPRYYGEMVVPTDLSEGDHVALEAAEVRIGGGTRYNGRHPQRAGTVRLASDSNVVVDTTHGDTVVITIPEGSGAPRLRTEDSTYAITALIQAEYENTR